jgi:SAM-dependent methyltransferase
MQKEHWFEQWFDSPYYHILYKNRDDQEAKANIGMLLQHLGLSKPSKILDLACGNGRYARYISEQGFDVTGYDLAPNNIQLAKQYASERLHFDVRDMRDDLGTEEFDAIFNLFTSFGYFDTKAEHLLCLQQIYKALKVGGLFVLDYLNAEKISKGLVPKEVLMRDGIEFHIKREQKGHQIIKEISFQTPSGPRSYQERVMAFKKNDFEDMFLKIGFSVQQVFGAFNGATFQSAQSDRLIFIVKK